MVFLYYLGTEGSSTSSPNLCNVYQIGCGTSKLNKCVMTAIIDCMKETYYKWLLAEDRKQISKHIMFQFDFPSCVRCMDGTLNLPTFEPQCQDASDDSGMKYGYCCVPSW